MIENIIRIGQVSSIDSSKCTARVTFPDRDNIVSYDLPVLQQNTGETKAYSMPSVGQNVVCVFLPFGVENGFIIGSYYNDQAAPPASVENMHITKFKDGTQVYYDDAAGAVVIDCVSTVLIKSTAGITLDDNVTITKSLTVANSITGGAQGGTMQMKGNVNIDGRIDATQDIKAGSVSLQNHVHGGVASGGSTSGGPL